MDAALPDWARWGADASLPAWTVGIEEEVMLLEPKGWTLVHVMDDLLPALSPSLASRVSPETHACILELETSVHATVPSAITELAALRAALAQELGPLGIHAAVAGTHPLAEGEDTEVSGSARYQLLEEGLRVLARREPTCALHVHVGVPIAELALAAFNRLRALLPLLLALSANSPFWRGMDTGMAAMRASLFGAFPRSGIPRRFASYEEYVETIDTLLRADAFPEPTFIWWDVRLQPRFGTIEVRIMDAQTRVADVAAIVALIQCMVRELATEPILPDELLGAQEVLEENRFIAERDGMQAQFIDPLTSARVPARQLLEDVLIRCRSHARGLDCLAELESVRQLAAAPGAMRQRDLATRLTLPEVVRELSSDFAQGNTSGRAGATPAVTAAPPE